MPLPRSVRNNNPGNLIYVPTIKWLGQTGPEDGQGRFAKFATPQHGWRACAKQIMTYKERYGLNTIRKIIDRWAPPNENNTEMYIRRVATALNVSPDETISVQDFATMKELVQAIADVESGGYKWDEKAGTRASVWPASTAGPCARPRVSTPQRQRPSGRAPSRRPPRWLPPSPWWRTP